MNEEIRVAFSMLWLLPTIFIHMFNNIVKLFIPPKSKDVKGQLALVTGGAKGLGRSLCIELAKKGCNIAIADLDMESAEETIQILQGLGVNAKSFKSDVSNFKEVEKLEEDIERDLGTVDILVNNAGILFCEGIIEEKPENLQKMIDINLMGSIWTVKVFLKGMIERKRGHIVGISSTAGLCGFSTAVCYSTSKFGLRGFMEALTMDLNYYRLCENIKTTCIFPWFMNTNPIIQSTFNEKCKHKLIFDPSEAAKYFVNQILLEEEVVTLPWSAYFLFYIM